MHTQGQATVPLIIVRGVLCVPPPPHAPPRPAPPCWPTCMRRAIPAMIKNNVTMVIPACEYTGHALGSVGSYFQVAELPAYPRGGWLGMPAGWVAGYFGVWARFRV